MTLLNVNISLSILRISSLKVRNSSLVPVVRMVKGLEAGAHLAIYAWIPSRVKIRQARARIRSLMLISSQIIIAVKLHQSSESPKVSAQLIPH